VELNFLSIWQKEIIWNVVKVRVQSWVNRYALDIGMEKDKSFQLFETYFVYIKSCLESEI